MGLSAISEKLSQDLKQAETFGTFPDITKNVTDLNAVLGVGVEITAVLGTTMMPTSHVLQLGREAVVELHQAAEENIDILADTLVVATGKVVILDDRLRRKY